MKPAIRDHGFEKMAAEMTTQKQHACYMRGVLADYQNYIQFMSGAFLEQPHDQIFTVRATYRQQKHTWRKIETLGTQTLADLASAIIESMDWMEDHLHGFWFPDQRRDRIYNARGIFHQAMEDDPHPTFKTDQVMISHIDWKTYPVMGFVFDFGDGHAFDISVKESRKKESSEKTGSFPRLVDQRGVAPEQYPPCEDFEE